MRTCAQRGVAPLQYLTGVLQKHADGVPPAELLPGSLSSRQQVHRGKGARNGALFNYYSCNAAPINRHGNSLRLHSGQQLGVVFQRLDQCGGRGPWVQSHGFDQPRLCT
jgi:hypothetical protein